MIEIKCPACGAEGRATKAKVNTRLVCRKCLKAFHVTATGRTVLGEPPTTGTTSTANPDQLAAADRTKNVDQWFEKLSKARVSWKRPAATLGVLLVLAILAYVISRRAEGLEDRVAGAARAAVNGDVRSLTAMAVRGTQDDVTKWLETVRPQCDQLRERLGPHKLRVQVDVKQDSGQGTVDVVARLDTEDDVGRDGGSIVDPSLVIASPPTSQSVSLPMSWRSDLWSGWRLDGTRTLVAALTTQGK
jgi:hypothetical protein